MKKILVPLDFSDAADNAMNYAIELAKTVGAKLVLFRVYDIPVITSDVIGIIPSSGELKQECLNELGVLRDKIHLRHGKELKVECHCTPGAVIEEINAYAGKHGIDLIVMGMRGAGSWTEKLIGSTATSLIREAVCPVLVIEGHVEFRPIKRIVLAVDDDEIGQTKALRPLKEWVGRLNARLYILHIHTGSGEAVMDADLERALEGTDHSFHSRNQRDVVEAINQFVGEHTADMVIMIPRKHQLLHTVLHEAMTRKMAFHTDIPLLALHE